MQLIFHSDDYGISNEQIKAILDCARDGCLNSVSVMVCSPDLSGSLNRLFYEQPDILCSVHLNFVEGRCSAEPAAVPLLVDERGYFHLSYEQMLLKSLLPGCAALKRQIKTEIAAQINAVQPFLPADRALRLDTHQHFHTIPLIFSAILEVIRENGLSVEYLRMPVEPIAPFFRHPAALAKIPPINYVKKLLVDFLSLFNRQKLKRSGIGSALFSGILLSGDMEADAVSRILPDFVKLARRRGMDLELLFHPGRLHAASECLDAKKSDFVRFNLSKNRDLEYAALHELKPLVQALSEEAVDA